MLIPLGTDQHGRRRAYVTQGLILVNMLVYLAGLVGQFAGAFEPEQIVAWGRFDPQRVQLWQLITYQFLHDPHDVFHLAFNMLFLWVFGSAVESRLGRLGFLLFYLAGGVMAGVGHMLMSPAPVIGASGSVAGVSGGFLALFPRGTVRVLLFFLIIGVYHVPAMWFIGFYFAIDLLNSIFGLFGRPSRVAYGAHLAGYVYGFAVCLLLLATGIVKRGEWDVFYLFKQSRRRAAFRAAYRAPTGAWESASADTGAKLAKQAAGELSERDEQQADLRSEIARFIERHELAAAAQRYRDLLALQPEAVLSERRQLDVANQLYAERQWREASEAYELLLRYYPASSSSSEVRLILGLIYARHLDRPGRARELLSDAQKRLGDKGQEALAEALLAELGP